VSDVDVAVVGGGPAGLAAAIEAARRGLSVRVFEKQTGVPDKACGEGLMPEGRRWLDARGVTPLIDPAWSSPFLGIRYLQEDGPCAEGRFRDGSGLGVRRLALVQALELAAVRAGARVEHGTAVKLMGQHPRGVMLEVGGATIKAGLVVAADGLASPIRRAAGLELEPAAVRRFGQRRHFKGLPHNDFVDVHWTDGVEAYVTPVGPGHCGIAFLWESRRDEAARFEDLLDRFPAIRDQVRQAEPISEVRGAGPLSRRIRSCVAGRVVLIGDAAGYVDAITGEGLSLSFGSASALGAVLPAAVRGDQAVLARYARVHARLFRKYALYASALVWLSRRPRWRRRALAVLRRAPWLFEGALSLVG